MRCIYVGNFGAPYSTENEIRRALVSLGNDVAVVQENGPDAFDSVVFDLTAPGLERRADLVLWTRTHWQPRIPNEAQLRMLLAASRAGVPVVGYHLDRWWGLKRERDVRSGTDPFFAVDLLVTADGGHDDEWASVGVTHAWLPPAVDAAQARADGTPRPEYASDVAFVGSWRPGYHPEWEHRAQLVAFLRRRYGDRCRFWPPKNEPAVRGPALADLYRSVKVVVGDSCLAGGAERYWSDRIPETLGRGGYLIHPFVAGLEDHFGLLHGPDLVAEPHLDTWEIGDWEALGERIDWALGPNPQRDEIAAAGRAHVLAHHTYEVRMRQLLELLVERAMLPVVYE